MIARALCAAALALACAPATAAAALALRDAGPVGDIVRGDGVRLIASSSNFGGPTPVTVLDSETHSRTTIPTPADCALRDIHHGTLLWSCRAPGELVAHGLGYDLAGGAVSRLAAPRPMPYSGADSGGYTAIGERWAKAVLSGYHFSYPVFVDRVTGAQRFDPRRRADLVADLDHPTLLRRLCRGQRPPTVIDDDSGIGTELGELATAGRWAAGTSQRDTGDGFGRVELQRCGARPRVVRVCRTVVCSQPVIGGGVVAWTESRFGTAPAGRVVVRSLRSGRTRRSATLRTAATPLLVGGRLYVVAGARLLRVAL